MTPESDRTPADEVGPSAGFTAELSQKLAAADRVRRRRAAQARWRRASLWIGPLIFAACWAAVPWTFAVGARALIGVVAFFTLVLSVAQRADTVFLSYLGVTSLPSVIDVLLLIGVVSWLVRASRPPAEGGR